MPATCTTLRGLIQALGAYVGVYVHRHVKNSHDQQLVFTQMFVIDDVPAMRELPVALTDVIACPSHQWVLRQSMEHLIHFFQVGISLADSPSAPAYISRSTLDPPGRT